MGYSTKRLNRHFLQATLSRSISSVNHTTQRHEFLIPALCSPATGRRASGPHRNTNACPRAVERVLTAEMRSKVPVALHAATFGPASRRAHELGAVWTSALEIAEELGDRGYQLRSLRGICAIS